MKKDGTDDQKICKVDVIVKKVILEIDDRTFDPQVSIRQTGTGGFMGPLVWSLQFNRTGG